MSDVEKVLLEPRFHQEGVKFNRWFVCAARGTSPDDTLKPTYWAHVARSLRPHDVITAVDDDEKWRVVLLVIDAWINGATVIELSRLDLSPYTNSELRGGDDGLSVKYRGTHLQWCIIRDKDGSVMKQGLPSKDIARSHLAANPSMMAAN